jgi:N-acyl-D-amino-acid deacylase
MLDYKIVNAEIIDVKNKTTSIKDIGIKDGVIEKIGSNIGDAARIIDAADKYLSSGFIDIHMHEEDLKITNSNDYDISLALLRTGVTTAVGGNCGSNRNDMKEFENFIREKGYPVNYMTYVGHNSLREKVGNYDPYIKSSRAQTEKIKFLVEEAIDNGAIGLSYGLEYCPGIDLDEAISIGEKIKNRDDLLLAFHARYDSKKALQAIDEIHNIVSNLNIPAQISHLSSVCAYGNMNECLAKIEAMIAKGMDLQADAYPYNAFSCKIGSTVFDEGCFENWGKSYESIMLAEEPYKGVICNEELFYKVRKEYPKMYVIAMMMNENEIIQALKKTYVFAASDGGYNNHQGHPRGAGTFAKVLGDYCLRKHELSLYEAIDKMTVMPARRLKIDNKKGIIKEGYDADIVIFNKNVTDQASFHEPQKPPAGIDYVFVNGGLSIDKGQHTKLNYGKFLKRS